MKHVLILLIIVAFMLSACSPAAAPSTPPQATTTPPPTPVPQPSPTPEPIIFFDGFEGTLADGWSWRNEDTDRWAFTPEGWLMLKAANPGFFSEEGSQQVNLLQRPAPQGDFVITTRLSTTPQENFQQAGIFIIADDFNYAAILNAICSFCLPDNGGHGFYMEAFKAGEYAAGGMAQSAPQLEEIFLRLIFHVAEGSIDGLYALAPNEWKLLGTIEGLPQPQWIALGAANAPSPEGIQEELVAFYDYFEVSRVETPVQRTADIPQPTAPPEPEPSPIPTALPAGMLFRDDFEAGLQPGWSWIQEDASRWRLTGDGWLEITGANPTFYVEGNFGLVNFLTRELPPGDFIITTHIKANPRENFHQATIYIFENAKNYIALNTGYCEPCLEGATGFFMETFIDNNPFENAYYIKRNPTDTDVYLRLVNQNGSLTGYYALEPGEWQKVAAFGNFFDFKMVGLGATNSNPNGVAQDIVALFDYFEISLP